MRTQPLDVPHRGAEDPQDCAGGEMNVGRWGLIVTFIWAVVIWHGIDAVARVVLAIFGK